jgi:two-component system, chemotaxis family, chemotaxis protein CheY
MSYNVLIVDDSSVMRMIVRRNIRQSGLQINQEFEAGDGQEALQVLTNHKVDFIFSDVNMPNMDGLTFVKEVRKKADLNYIKIIMITTEAGIDIVNDAVSSGADGYLVKPFTPAQIMGKIESVVESL